jgi:HTH-type transcriptional regulator / antitoxin HigA
VIVINIKPPSSYYMELITEFPPRPITNEAELVATQERINVVLDKRKITQDDRDYLKILGMLVYEYEEEHEPPMPTLKGIGLLKALMEESHLQSNDLIPLLGDEVVIAEILNAERLLTQSQIAQLAEFFHISPASF